MTKASNLQGDFPLLEQLIQAFEAARDPVIAEGQAAYMRNRFAFLGVRKPVLASIQRPLFRQYPIQDAETLREVLLNLWALEYREFHYAACELAGYHKKLFMPELLETFEFMIRTHSWWDSVDTIASHLVGTLLQQYPARLDVMDRWIDDPNLWIRRTALIYQLKYKHQTDSERLFSYCVRSMDESDFFIRKAIGWALREYAKTDPEAVIRFVSANHPMMSPLSIREALKHFPQERQRFLGT